MKVRASNRRTAVMATAHTCITLPIHLRASAPCAACDDVRDHPCAQCGGGGEVASGDGDECPPAGCSRCGGTGVDPLHLVR